MCNIIKGIFLVQLKQMSTSQNKILPATRQIAEHPFHVLTDSKLPIFLATFAGLLATAFVVKLHLADAASIFECNRVAASLFDPFFSVNNLDYISVNAVILTLLVFLGATVAAWSYSLVEESAQGHHTARVQLALKYGMLLFLVSEIMLFFPFFWAFFHGSLAPSIAIGAVWPPVGIKDIETLNPFMLPLLNTVVLLCSGVAVVAAHRAILAGYKIMVLNTLYIAISFGILFSWLQFLEYGLTRFTLNDGLYGSVFFMLTGLHGFHVIVGTVLLLIAYVRTINNSFSTTHHVGFEVIIWYWHFVDVV
jgi:heme/copper-type cytochrome/quinol oxidase subunit 3